MELTRSDCRSECTARIPTSTIKIHGVGYKILEFKSRAERLRRSMLIDDSCWLDCNHREHRCPTPKCYRLVVIINEPEMPQSQHLAKSEKATLFWALQTDRKTILSSTAEHAFLIFYFKCTRMASIY